jgi:hypothetical protein
MGVGSWPSEGASRWQPSAGAAPWPPPPDSPLPWPADSDSANPWQSRANSARPWEPPAASDLAGTAFSGGDPARPSFGTGVPRAGGTIYGGQGRHRRVDLPTAGWNHPSVENSQSLTGHILAQGWSDSTPTSRSNRRVVIILGAVLLAMIVFSVVVFWAAGDSVRSVLNGLLNG